MHKFNKRYLILFAMLVIASSYSYSQRANTGRSSASKSAASSSSKSSSSSTQLRSKAAASRGTSGRAASSRTGANRVTTTTKAGTTPRTTAATTTTTATTTVTDFTMIEIKDKVYTFENIAKSYEKELNAFKAEIIAEQNKADAEFERMLSANISDCSKKFNGCMKSGSVCGANYENCATLNLDQVTLKKQACEGVLIDCGVSVSQDVWANFIMELDNSRQGNLDSAKLAAISKCDSEIESCMAKACRGEKYQYELCFDSISRATYRATCLEVIDRCQSIGSYGYDKVISKIEKDQKSMQNEFDAWQKACENINGTFNGVGSCTFDVSLKYPAVGANDPGEIKLTFNNGEVLKCDAATFGYDPISGVKSKVEGNKNIVTGVAAGVGAIAGGILGGKLQAGTLFKSSAEKEAKAEAKAEEKAEKKEQKAADKEIKQGEKIEKSIKKAQDKELDAALKQSKKDQEDLNKSIQQDLDNMDFGISPSNN